MKEKERRTSLRRDSKSMCELRIGTEVSRGPVINYAEGDGIGIIIKNNRNISKGAQAHITIIDTGIEFLAEIAWTEKLDFDFVRIGLRNITGKPADKKPHDQTVIKKTGGIEETSEKQSPDVQPEQNTSPEKASEPDQEYVMDYQNTEEELSDVRPEAATEKAGSRKTWHYVVTASILVILLGTAISLLHYKDKSVSLPQSAELAKQVPHTAEPPAPKVITAKTPSFRDAAIAKLMTGSTERTVPLPDFREDALKGIQRD